MDDSYRSLRATLAAIGTAYFAFGILLLFHPQTIGNIYEGGYMSGLHLYLGSGFGALLLVLAIGSFFAFARPVKHEGIIILLVLAQFFLFITDIILLAREEMRIMTLLPEMLYFLLTGVLLVRYFPTEKNKATKQENNKAIKIETNENNEAIKQSNNEKLFSLDNTK